MDKVLPLAVSHYRNSGQNQGVGSNNVPGRGRRSLCPNPFGGVFPYRPLSPG